jgi:hypothetical protein
MPKGVELPGKRPCLTRDVALWPFTVSMILCYREQNVMGSTLQTVVFNPCFLPVSTE